MLQDGNTLKRKGVDVVVGYVESHGRTDTDAQIAELEVVPRRKYGHRGVSLEEMDVDAIIARKPEVVLIDELAHTNAPGSKHEKRYQDIEDVLAAGIAVFSTCNIQHIESVHDMVERMTGVHVRERVPDSFFTIAKEMIMVDVTPEELIDRMKAGKIYKPEKIDHSLANFFTPGNLSMLRELALRELANDVEYKSREKREEVSKSGQLSSEKILVAIPSRENAASVIRAGSRIANRSNAKWYVVHVEPTAFTPSSEAESTLNKLFKLSRDLGANVIQLRGKDVAASVLQFAKEEGITQIVIGATQRPWWKRMLSGSVVANLLSQVGEIAVHVYPVRDIKVDSAIVREPEVSSVTHVTLSSYLPSDHIIVGLKSVQTVEQTISILLDHLIQCEPEFAPHRQHFLDLVMRRERVMSTFLDTGIAIPHAAGLEEITDIKAVMALTPQGVLSLDRQHTAYVVLLFFSPAAGRANHLKFLSSVARLFIDKTVTREIAGATDSSDAYEQIKTIEEIGRK